jgi:hypothetical protein
MRIEDADVVLGIFWKRFGTPTSDAGSGTEHELRRAWAAWQSRAQPQVMVYFCERKSRPKDASEAAELPRLLSFREAMPKEQLCWTYTTLLEFERAVREHLTALSTLRIDRHHRHSNQGRRVRQRSGLIVRVTRTICGTPSWTQDPASCGECPVMPPCEALKPFPDGSIQSARWSSFYWPPVAGYSSAAATSARSCTAAARTSPHADVGMR